MNSERLRGSRVEKRFGSGARGVRVLLTGLVVFTAASVTGCASRADARSGAPSQSGSDSTVAIACPPASVVNTIMGGSYDTPSVFKTSPPQGSSVSGTVTTCEYDGPSLQYVKVAIEAPATAAVFNGEEESVSGSGAPVQPIAGLGDEAFQAGGAQVYVLKGGYLVTVSSFTSSLVNLEALARQIISG